MLARARRGRGVGVVEAIREVEGDANLGAKSMARRWWKEQEDELEKKMKHRPHQKSKTDAN